MGNMTKEEIKNILSYNNNSDYFKAKLIESQNLTSWYENKLRDIENLRKKLSNIPVHLDKPRNKRATLLDYIKEAEDNSEAIKEVNLINSQINLIELEINNKISEINEAYAKCTFYSSNVDLDY